MPEKRPLGIVTPPVDPRTMTEDERRAWLRRVLAAVKAQEHIWADTDPENVAPIMAGFTGRVVFDVGANVGQSAHVFKHTFWRIVSFEPAIESFEVLVDQVPENCLPLNVAVSDINGEVELTIYEEHMKSGQLATGGQSQWLDVTVGSWGKVVGTRTVPCVTLDLFASMTGLTPDLIKIDVEGHELRVIEGAMGLIRRRMPQLYIEVHGKELGEAIRRLLEPVYEHRLEAKRHVNYAEGSTLAAMHYWLIVQ